LGTPPVRKAAIQYSALSLQRAEAQVASKVTQAVREVRAAHRAGLAEQQEPEQAAREKIVASLILALTLPEVAEDAGPSAQMVARR
jgi:hypothetical protein